MKDVLNTIILFALSLAMLSCSAPGSGENQSAGVDKIVCTTGMIADAVQHVVGEQAEVEALMGPGVDPHLYKATQGDLRRLNSADVIFYNGLHLEGKMGEVLEKLGRLKPVIPVGEIIPESELINTTGYAGAYDPHLWFDVALWSEVVAYIGEKMQELDPEHAAEYRENARRYQQKLLTLDKHIADQIATIPKPQRVMITAHDAFEYFGRAYGIEVRGLQGISTLSEYGLKDVTDLVNFIVEREIRAVFVESSVPRKALEAVIEGCAGKGHEVKIGGTLFSDAMGAAGTPEGTYTGMVKHNVRTIVESLGGSTTELVSERIKG